MNKEIRYSGIGVDIESISRFENKTLEKDFVFLTSIFTSKELEYCFSHSKPAKHMAARYCAKEAAVKALSHYLCKSIPYNQIEVGNHPDGCPHIRILNTGCDADNIRLQVSMSHEKEKAIAFVTASAVSETDVK